MGDSAFILGGSGQIGRAIALSLVAAGWSVVSGQRDVASLPEALRAQGVVAVALDREDFAALRDALTGGFDAVIDTVAYTAAHARQCLELQDQIGALVVISSGSVYADSQGRTLDEARESGFPVFPVPILESQPRTAAGDATYSTRKVAMEAGGSQVLNAADPEALTVAQIGQAILDTMGSPARLAPFVGPPKGLVGRTPWSVELPLVADMSAAAALGYRPVTDYRAAARATCEALVEAARGRDWREAFPGLAPYPAAMFEVG